MALPATIPAHTGHTFVPTARHDTYDAINPATTDLSGKVVLVTGASKGIGRAISIAFAQAGVSGLALLARNKSGLEATEKSCLEAQRPGSHLKIRSTSTDITDTKGVAAALKDVEATFGRLDIVINNAGLMYRFQTIEEVDPDEWWSIWSTNIKGLFNVTRAALPLLISCGGLKTIVNLTSVAAHHIVAGWSAYQTSKLAVLRLSEAIVAEYGDKGVLSYAIHPGGIATDMAAQMPEDWMSFVVDTPEVAAHSIVFYSRERRDWLAGRYLSAQWDVDELLSKKDEIIAGDKLKVRMVV